MLFRLYLPHRYTYPLIPFFAIAAAVLLRPTWDVLAARAGPVRVAHWSEQVWYSHYAA